MENSTLALLSAWSSYYVIVGSSAAALTGLQFVVIALVAETGLHSGESVAAFGTPTVFHFCLSLVVAAFLSAPWQSLFPLSWLLVTTGTLGLLYVLVVIRRARRQTSYRPVAEDWLWHAILPALAYGVIIGAAALLSRAPAFALFPIGAAVLLLILIGIHNAWDSVAYVATQPRTKPRK